jgi:hypothetical protein
MWASTLLAIRSAVDATGVAVERILSNICGSCKQEPTPPCDSNKWEAFPLTPVFLHEHYDSDFRTFSVSSFCSEEITTDKVLHRSYRNGAWKPLNTATHSWGNRENMCTEKGYCLLVTQEYKLPKRNPLKMLIGDQLFTINISDYTMIQWSISSREMTGGKKMYGLLSALVLPPRSVWLAEIWEQPKDMLRHEIVPCENPNNGRSLHESKKKTVISV